MQAKHSGGIFAGKKNGVRFNESTSHFDSFLIYDGRLAKQYSRSLFLQLISAGAINIPANLAGTENVVLYTLFFLLLM